MSTRRPPPTPPTWALGLLALGGCGSLGTCEVPPPSPALAACAQDDRAGADLDLPALRLEFSGEILEGGRGLPEAHCLDSGFALGDAVDDFAQPDLRWFVVQDNSQGGTFTVVYYAPELPLPVLSGEYATVYYARGTDAEGAVEGELLVYDGATRLRLYIGQAPNVAALQLPTGVSMTEGEPLCTARDDCDGRRVHRLEVEYQGEQASLLPGEYGPIGAGWAQHGVVEVDRVPGSCGRGDRALVAFTE